MYTGGIDGAALAALLAALAGPAPVLRHHRDPARPPRRRRHRRPPLVSRRIWGFFSRFVRKLETDRRGARKERKSGSPNSKLSILLSPEKKKTKYTLVCLFGLSCVGTYVLVGRRTSDRFASRVCCLLRGFARRGGINIGFGEGGISSIIKAARCVCRGG